MSRDMPGESSSLVPELALFNQASLSQTDLLKDLNETQGFILWAPPQKTPEQRWLQVSNCLPKEKKCLWLPTLSLGQSDLMSLISLCFLDV